MFYIGQVCEVISDERYQVKFLEKVVDGKFRWPKHEDTAVVEHRFVFSLVEVTPSTGMLFNMKESYEKIHKLYKEYKRKYFRKQQKSKSGVSGDVQITKCVSKASPFHFSPVDKTWQQKQCKKHGLKFIKQFTSCRKKTLTQCSPPGNKELTQPDGNCYFRAISSWVTGTSEQHAKVRMAVVEFMSNEWKESGERIIGEPVEEYLRKSAMESCAVWASEKEIFATAEMLALSVYVYTDVGRTRKWVPHHPIKGATKNALYLCNISHHFEPVKGM